MPHYRFVLTDAETGVGRAQEFGLFNDSGALQFARRYAHGREVEVWESERLVGRVEPAPTLRNVPA
jgi:hypothetical protein